MSDQPDFDLTDDGEYELVYDRLCDAADRGRLGMAFPSDKNGTPALAWFIFEIPEEAESDWLEREEDEPPPLQGLILLMAYAHAEARARLNGGGDASGV